MTIVIPCAQGRNRWHRQYAPATRAAPLVKVWGKPIIEWVLRGIGHWPVRGLRYVFVVLERDEVRDYMTETLRPMVRCPIVVLTVRRPPWDELTTVMMARDSMGRDEPLLVAGADIWTVADVTSPVVAPEPCRASVVVVPDREPVRTRSLEPDPFRRRTLLYYFPKASDFLEAADRVARRRVAGRRLDPFAVIEEFLKSGWPVQTVVAREAWAARSWDSSLAFHERCRQLRDEGQSFAALLPAGNTFLYQQLIGAAAATPGATGATGDLVQQRAQ